MFEAYQVAALELLASQGDELGERAGIVLAERFPEPSPISEEPPTGFPGPENGIGLTTFFTELVKKPKLRTQLWPLETNGDFRERFRRREQRRELLSAMARLGAAYIDLYLLAIKQLGSFDLGPQTDEDAPGEDLASAFVGCLDQTARRSWVSCLAGTFQCRGCIRSAVISQLPRCTGRAPLGDITDSMVPRSNGKYR